jgi:hypothetical protein
MATRAFLQNSRGHAKASRLRNLSRESAALARDEARRHIEQVRKISQGDLDVSTRYLCDENFA